MALAVSNVPSPAPGSPVMHRWSLLLCAALFAGLAVSVCGQGDGKKEVKLEKAWTGRLVEREKEPLRKLAPTIGYISGPKTFTMLWKAWRTEEKVPEVDFSKKLILVGTAGGPNDVKLSAVVDGQGNLTIRSLATLVGGPGFGYALAQVDRDGVKSVQGKPLQNDE
jgi:hypothetical protein